MRRVVVSLFRLLIQIRQNYLRTNLFLCFNTYCIAKKNLFSIIVIVYDDPPSNEIISEEKTLVCIFSNKYTLEKHIFLDNYGLCMHVDVLTFFSHVLKKVIFVSSQMKVRKNH